MNANQHLQAAPAVQDSEQAVAMLLGLLDDCLKSMRDAYPDYDHYESNAYISAMAVFENRTIGKYRPPQADQVERWRHDSEDLEALHNNLDGAGTPRHDSSGIEYSEWGRVIQYAKAAAQAEADVLAEALERCMGSMRDAGFNVRSAVMAQGWQALAAYRKQGGGQ